MCDPGVGVDRLFHALYAPRAARMLMLLGTACSDVTETIAKIVPYWNIVQHVLYLYPCPYAHAAGQRLLRRTETIAKIVPYWNIVQVSFGSTSPALSDRSEFPLFCRTVAPDSSHNPARIAFIRQYGWDTVTAFSQNEEVYSLAVNELVTQLEAANISCAASITFAETDFKQQLLLLKELDTRIIIGSFSQEMIPKIFCEVSENPAIIA
ncbi:unnamed protein product [Plutella xylostella]|uniref:(diamondback moth) hypothetical protein n=1 Tax=Plutella xylostella TaxID=51655 RepID=A0A8S4FQ08_PLUXY|nr:unnamed protein product [Plutella xylostella]